MASNSDNFTPQQYRKYNGQSVFKALSAMGSEASADDLAEYISQDIGAREDAILPEVRNVLQRGISNGFLRRRGQYYSFITDESSMQVDSVQSRPKQWSTRKGRTSSRSRPSNAETEENVSDEEVGEEEQSEDENVYDDCEEMQTDNTAMPRPPKVKLYEIYNPPRYETDDEQNEDSEDEDVYEKPPPQKRIRLLPILPRSVKKH